MHKLEGCSTKQTRNLMQQSSTMKEKCFRKRFQDTFKMVAACVKKPGCYCSYQGNRDVWLLSRWYINVQNVIIFWHFQ